MWSQLLSQLSSSSATSDIPWNVIEEFRSTSVSDSSENDYLNCCKIILLQLDQSSLIIEGRESLLEDILLKKRLGLIPILCSQFSHSEQSFRRDAILHILTTFLFRKNHLAQAFGRLIEKESSQVGQSQLVCDEMINLFINIPSIVANKMQLKIPSTFIPVNYFTRLSSIIFILFDKVHKRIRKGKDCRTNFICHLTGRISSSGYSEIVWKHVMSPLLLNCSTDFIWRRLGNKLITSQSDRNVEGIIRPCIMFAAGPSQLKWILQDGPLSSTKMCYLLTEKFILNNHYDQHLFITNLIGYLANTSVDLFIKAFDNLLVAWSNGSALKHRPFDQQFYICCGLSVSAKYLKSTDSNKFNRDNFIHRVIYAMQIYLSAVLPEIRFTGLYIGKLLLSILQIDGPSLELEIENIPEVVTLTNLYESSTQTIESDSDEQKSSKMVDDLQVPMSQLSTAHESREEESEDEDEDDLIPYDLSNDIKVDRTKKPIYVTDCIAGLRDTENADWNETCLKAAIDIIEKNGSMIDDYAEDFAITLLHLQDTFELPDFVTLRRDSMVKLLTVSPIIVSTYLTGQFYDNNLVIERRLLILETLAMASQEISKSSRTDVNKESQIITQVIPNDIYIAEAKWKTIVEERIMSKTKIISKPKPSAKSHVNKFTPIAGYFFFPLMKHHDSPNITFNLVGEDYYLLGRLLYTLGIILESTSQAPVTRRMGKSLIDFLWAFRYHVESFVRQAIIFCLSMIFISVPRAYLLDYMQGDLIEFQKWLMDVTERDTDKDCIERALSALFLIKQLIDTEEV